MDKQNIVIQSDAEALIGTLKSIGKGEFIAEITKNMQKAIKATMHAGKNSTITIKITIKQTSDESIVIEGESKTTVPVQKNSAAFFIDQQFLPTRNKPNQPSLELVK